jgi:hypothetical protein
VTSRLVVLGCCTHTQKSVQSLSMPVQEDHADGADTTWRRWSALREEGVRASAAVGITS